MLKSHTRYGTYYPNRDFTPTEELYGEELAKQGLRPNQIIGVLNAGIELSDVQCSWSVAARDCDDPEGPEALLVGGARGGGKSTWVLAQLGLDDCQRFPGLTCLWLRKVGKRARESMQELRATILMGVEHSYAAARGEITFRNGSRIVTGHYDKEKDIDGYLGQSYDCIALEEATQISGNMYTAILGSLRSSKKHPETNERWRPRVYATTNPGGVGHVFFKHKFVDQETPDPRNRYLPALVDDNPFVDADYIGRLDEFEGWQYDAYRLGSWDLVIGQYFVNFAREHHVGNFSIDPDTRAMGRWWLSYDYGFQHRAIWTLFMATGDGDVLCCGQAGGSHLIPAQQAEHLKELLARWNVKLNQISRIVAGHDCWSTKGGDEGASLTVAKTFAKLKIDGTPIKLTRAIIWRVTGCQTILQLLGNPKEGRQARIRIHTSCTRLIDQLQTLEHDPNNPEDVSKKKAELAGGDDEFDSFRYGIMEADRRRQTNQREL